MYAQDEGALAQDEIEAAEAERAAALMPKVVRDAPSACLPGRPQLACPILASNRNCCPPPPPPPLLLTRPVAVRIDTTDTPAEADSSGVRRR